ncbi:MAG: hypothetical protein WC340_08880 [Kiritimatiellia bacterium]
MKRLAWLLIPALMAGCTHIGTKSVQRDMPGFNEAMALATDEQLLNNLVRLRFKDSPAFMSVASIMASESLSMGSSAGLAVTDINPLGTESKTKTFGGQIGYSQMPTISYRPLQGVEFSQRLTRPIKLETMMFLGISGFDFLTIWELFTESFHTQSPPPLARPLADSPFADEVDVEHFGQLLLQIGDENDFMYRDPFKSRQMRAMPGAETESLRKRNASVMAEILLKRFAAQYSKEQQMAFRSNYLTGDVVLIYRSLLGVLYDLSAATDNTNPYLKILSGSHPQDAYCATKYRGTLYWVAYADENSKTTISLLSILYNAISDTGEAAMPNLSIPLR